MLSDLTTLFIQRLSVKHTGYLTESVSDILFCNWNLTHSQHFLQLNELWAFTLIIYYFLDNFLYFVWCSHQECKFVNISWPQCIPSATVQKQMGYLKEIILSLKLKCICGLGLPPPSIPVLISYPNMGYVKDRF